MKVPLRNLDTALMEFYAKTGMKIVQLEPGEKKTVDAFIEGMGVLGVDLSSVSKTIDEKLSEEQSEWLLDENKCSGCGEGVTKYDNNCPECGLKLSNKIYTIPLDVTKYQNKRFKYHYKDKKDDK